MEEMIKAFPDDFRVSECLAPGVACDEGEDGYFYYWLTKKGYTTFEAIDKIADFCHIDSKCIYYAGLKDEDGITEQSICLDKKDARKMMIEAFNERYHNKESFLHLKFKGIYKSKIKIGGLFGNGFDITIRNISEKKIHNIISDRKYILYYLNYYDIQRFGIPGQKQSTHLIGQALLNKDMTRAMDLLKENGTPEGVLAQNHTGCVDDFFRSLDKRKVTFYLNSWESFQWNERLKEILCDISKGESIENSKSGNINFVFSNNINNVINVLKKTQFITHKKYVSTGEGIICKEGTRASVIQTQIHLISHDLDELNNAKYKAQVQFFNPAGCYATMALRQYLLLKA